MLVAIVLRKGGARTLRDDWSANFAHRGASARAPENTLEAFRLAVEAGAGGLELDVNVTRDGEIVVIHDTTVDRTTEGSGVVTAKTFDDLRSLNAGYRFSPDGGAGIPHRRRESGYRRSRRSTSSFRMLP
jgi:glycerophosphoryl diester phosphodiesterase